MESTCYMYKGTRTCCSAMTSDDNHFMITIFGILLWAQLANVAINISYPQTCQCIYNHFSMTD